MAETDAFERRLRAALVRHVDGGPTEFDALGFARLVASKEPRRHGLGVVLGWRVAGVPRVAWALLLAALLTALVGGTLLVGSQLERRLPAVVPPIGEVYECPPGSTPDEPGPADQAWPVESMWAFDRRAGRLVALADGVTGVETWTFDVCTNAWTQMHPDREPPRDMNQLVYDVDSDVTIASDGVRMWVYDLGANAWTERGPFAPVGDARRVGLEFYDPVSGLVVARGDDGVDDTLGLALWSYDVESDTWGPIRSNPLVIGPHYEFLSYDPSVDRLVAYAKTWERGAGLGDWVFKPTTWLLDLRTGTWEESRADTPGFFSAGMWGLAPGIANDEAAGRTVLMGQGHSAAYDATADRWETLWAGPAEEGACGTRPECRQMPGVVYDPVNGRLIVRGGSVYTSASGWVDPNDLLAFNTRTRTWTVLLQPSRRQPSSPPE